MRFLSAEWAQKMTDALNASEDFKGAAAGKDVRVQQVVVDDGAGEDMNYFFMVEEGRARVALGEVDDADAVMTQSYETAAAIMKQELNPQQAFMQGKVKISGNLMKLFQMQPVFSAVPRAVRGVEVDYTEG